MALVTLACEPGVSVYFKNVADVPVTVYWGPERADKNPDLRLQPTEEKVAFWVIGDPEKLNVKVTGKDETGKVVFCRVYSSKDRIRRIREDSVAVVIVPGENSC